VTKIASGRLKVSQLHRYHTYTFGAAAALELAEALEGASTGARRKVAQR